MRSGWRRPARYSPSYVTHRQTRITPPHVTNLDFMENPEGSRETINQWVEGKTRNRIRDLLPAGSIDSATALVITNAIYFKGNWARSSGKRIPQKPISW